MLAPNRVVYTIVWIFFLVTLAGCFPQLLVQSDTKKNSYIHLLYNMRITGKRVGQSLHEAQKISHVHDWEKSRSLPEDTYQNAMCV